jgi:hypothetical protein
MARYFLHLRDSVDEVLDPEGLEMPLRSVPGAALLAARDCMAGDIMAGKLDLHYRIDVHSEGGDVVHTLRFEDAVVFAAPR